MADYDEFISGLDEVWRNCHRAMVPGGRLVINVGDVCLSRRRNNGRHTVVPLHATIREHCRAIGFDNLAPIIWHKISNANYEVSGGGASSNGFARPCASSGSSAVGRRRPRAAGATPTGAPAAR